MGGRNAGVMMGIPTGCRSAVNPSAIVVILLLAFLLVPVKAFGSIRHTRHRGLLNTVSGSKDDGMNEGPSGGIPFPSAVEGYYESSIPPGTEGSLVSVMKEAMKGWQSAPKTNGVSANDAVSKLATTTEALKKVEESSRDEDLLDGEVDVLADLLYDTMEYENDLDLNLDIDLPLLLVMEDRDATADIMEIIEEQVRDLMITMDSKQTTPPSVLHPAKPNEAKSRQQTQGWGNSSDVQPAQRHSAEELHQPLASMASGPKEPVNTLLTAGEIKIPDLPSVHIHEDIHSHGVATFQQNDDNQPQGIRSRMQVVEGAKTVASEFMSTATRLAKKAPLWIIPVAIGCLLLCTGMIGVSRGWFDQHSMDNLEPPPKRNRRLTGIKSNNTMTTAGPGNALSPIDCSSKTYSPEDWPSLHSPRATAMDRLRRNHELKKAKRMKPEV